MSDILRELSEVFRSVFRDPSLAVNESTTAADIAGWDSLTHMRLVSEVEKKFGLEFSFDEVRNLDNVGDFARLIISKKGD